MIRNCFVVGTGGHCRTILSILQEPESNYFAKGIFDLESPVEGEKIFNVPVLGHVSELEKLNIKKTRTLFLAIGDNKLRAEFFRWALSSGFALPNLISRLATIKTPVKLGTGNVVCPLAYLGPYSEIGDNNILNTRCTIEHEVKIGCNSHVAPASILAGRVIIENEVFIGLGSKVIEKTKVVSKVIIGAGALVLSDIDTPGVYYGIPVKKGAER